MTKYNTIILNEKNNEKIENILNDVQKMTRVRNITLEDIYKAKDEIEKYVLKYTTKNALEMTMVWVDINAQSFPNAYHGWPTSTQFCFLYQGHKWRITPPSRSKVDECKYRICWSKEAEKIAIHRLSIIK